MKFTVSSKNGSSTSLVMERPSVVLAGYTGRDTGGVKAHIDELAKQGIPAPATVPEYYRVPWQLLTFPDHHLEVWGEQTSGEVEPVLVVTESKTYVTVGSDHTDRKIQKSSIECAKQLAPKIIAETLWSIEEVQDHWDQLELTSRIKGKDLYQNGKVAGLLPPSAFPIKNLKGSAQHLVLFLGTIPAVDGNLIFSPTFEGQLNDPIAGRSIVFSYTVNALAGR